MPNESGRARVEIYCMVAATDMDQNGLNPKMADRILYAVYRHIGGIFVAIFTGTSDTLRATAELVRRRMTTGNEPTLYAQNVIHETNFDLQHDTGCFRKMLEIIAKDIGKIGVLLGENPKLLVVADELLIRKNHHNDDLGDLRPGDIVPFVYTVDQRNWIMAEDVDIVLRSR